MSEHEHTPQPRLGELPVAVVGCDFRVASTAWRNAVLLDRDARRELLDRLRRSAGATGLCVLETCNRVEWLIDAPDPRWAADLARAAMMAQWRTAGMPPPLPTPYVAVGEEAVRHLAHVVVGLESFVVGEREIAGQLNRAMDEARDAGLSTPGLNALQTTLGRVVRAVERGTAFRAHARGVHGLAWEAARAHLGGRDGASVLVVGMGEIGRKAAALCERERGWHVVRVNRTIDAAHDGAWRALETLPALLPQADVVIVATGARTPILGADALQPAVEGRASDRPLLLVDLGAPNQVERPASPAQWRVVGLDELLVRHGETAEPAELARVLALVEDAVAEHRSVHRKREAGPLLRAVWDGYDELAWTRMPALFEQHGAALTEEQRRALADGLREAMRAHCRRIVGVVDGEG
ncbi:MAG: hypothetical protein RIT45_2404 [Pseudomonadota bacterium]|jgi:glutamyl-tRNA reductase